MNESGTFTDAIHHCARAARLSIEIAMDHVRTYVTSAGLLGSDTSRPDPEAGLIGEELPLLNERKFRLHRRPVRSQLLRGHRTSLARFAARALESTA
jgi:hypothetical protein